MRQVKSRLWRRHWHIYWSKSSVNCDFTRSYCFFYCDWASPHFCSGCQRMDLSFIFLSKQQLNQTVGWLCRLGIKKLGRSLFSQFLHSCRYRFLRTIYFSDLEHFFSVCHLLGLGLLASWGWTGLLSSHCISMFCKK